MYHASVFDVYDTKENHLLYEYFDRMTAGAKNMYNVANFNIRQLMTGLKKESSSRTPNEQNVIDRFEKLIPAVNKRRSGRKNYKPLKMPTASKWFAGYNLLDAVFSEEDDPDYRAVYCHVAQNAIKECVQAWRSFFAKRKTNPNARIPGYKKNERTTAKFNNQGVRIEDGVLTFPLTKEKFKLGSFPHSDDKLIEVKIMPYYGHYQIHVITDDQTEPLTKCDPMKPCRAMMIDLGVDNFAAITDSIGKTPIAVKGGYIKSINQNWNRMISKLKSIQMKGHDPKTYHPAYTKRMNALTAKRDRIFRDMFYKISHFICRTAEKRGIGIIIVGKNSGWKQNSDMGRKSNQAFTQIPYARFIHILGCVALSYGMDVITQEESYTSKSSFIDGDPIPTYGHEPDHGISMSGRRVKRGLYKSADGTEINADVNGSLNIGRKYDPWMFDGVKDRHAYAETTRSIGYRDFHPEAKGK